MTRILTALLLAALSFAASAEVWQARYGVAGTFVFKLYNADGSLDVDEVDGGTEVSLSCNEGAETTATNDFVDEGTFYSIALTQAEMECERIAVVIAATTTEVFFIQTHSNASAMTPTVNSNVMTVEGTDATDTLGTAQTGDSFARLGAPAGASHAADNAAIKSDTAATLTDTADMQPKLGTFPDLGSGATLAGNLEDMRDDGTATYSRTTDSLQAIRDRGDAAWTTGAGACPDDVVCTTVATAPTTTTFTATAAPNDDTQLDGWAVLFTDNGDADSYCLRTISGVSTGTITYGSACPFTVAAGDAVAFLPAFLDLGVDVTAISGDTTAADNLEAALDGTGGVTITAALTGNVTGNLSGSAGSVTGAVGSVTGAVGSVSGNVGGNVTGSVGSVATGGIASTSFAAGAIDAAALAADAGTEIGTATWASTTRLLTAGTNIALAKGTGVTGFNDLSAAQVNAEVDTALVDIHLDHLFATDYDPASKPGTATALLNELVESDAGVSRYTANALEQAPSGGGSADWTADERTAISAILGLDGTATPSDPTVGILNTIRDDTVDLQSRIPAVLVGGRMDSSAGAMAANVMTAAAAAADLTTELQSGLATSSAVSALDTKLGTPAGASMSADTAAVKSDTAAILVDTAEIGVAGAGLTAVDDAVLAAIAALNDLSTTEVRDLVIEDQGSGVSLGCALAVLLAYASGDIATTGSTTTYEDPSGTETRTTGTVASAGNRTATITCPTY